MTNEELAVYNLLLKDIIDADYTYRLNRIYILKSFIQALNEKNNGVCEDVCEDCQESEEGWDDE